MINFKPCFSTLFFLFLLFHSFNFAPQKGKNSKHKPRGVPPSPPPKHNVNIAPPKPNIPPPQQHQPVPPPQQNNNIPPQQNNNIPPQQNNYVPPPQQNNYVPPPPQQNNYVPPPQQNNYVPPPQQNNYVPPQQQNNYVPPPQQQQQKNVPPQQNNPQQKNNQQTPPPKPNNNTPPPNVQQNQKPKAPLNLTAEAEKHYKAQTNNTNPNTQKKQAQPKINEKIKPDKIETKNPTQEIKKEKTKKEIKEEQDRQEFEKKVAGFDFSDLLTMKLRNGQTEILQEKITQPCKFYFLFMVNHPKQKIDFMLKGPMNIDYARSTPKSRRSREPKDYVLLNLRDKNYFFYEYEASVQGTYSFHFINSRHKENAKVTYAINVMNPNDEAIKIEKFDNITQQIVGIDQKLNELRIKGNLYTKKLEGHKQSVLRHNRSIVIYAIIEVIVMSIIFIVQWYYLRKLVEKL